eukprot:TRINITY_DN5461_c0_g3_i2.p1 TRINITY_DN5461_c0_g3~~TRINITY_DN5461_c0_g3_i2.p1  ORF type:complete len:147 (-),score=24.35 TRINITY_DN5461_c0_g3_i2:181-591(-)
MGEHVVPRLLQVPEVQALAPDYCDVIHRWAAQGDVTWVEYFLRNEQVVAKLGWAPEIAHHADTRHEVAIARCAGNEVFRRQLVEALRLAYVCVGAEMYPGLAEHLCQYVLPAPLARQVLVIQRGFSAALQRLRECR